MACRKTWWRKCVPGDRGIYKDRHVRIIIECPESILHLEAEYIYADCPFAQLQTSCSPAADHTFATTIFSASANSPTFIDLPVSPT